MSVSLLSLLFFARADTMPKRKASEGVRQATRAARGRRPREQDGEARAEQRPSCSRSHDRSRTAPGAAGDAATEGGEGAGVEAL